MHAGLPVFMEAQLWRAELQIEAARAEGDALWWHGFLCGLAIAFIVAIAAYARRRRKHLENA